MKHKATHLLLAAFFGALTAHAQLSIPSDGSDGAFAPATNVEIDLGLAATATWNTAGSGNGVYDPDKWAVVFKYSSVNIPNGVKVTFKNHPTYAPVVWLVQGSVTIDGELNLDGKPGTSDAVSALIPAEPGPGGFRGAAKGPNGDGTGYGPGGRQYYGRFASVYGNPQNIPLIGGSGGYSAFGKSGGAGGGAMAIFASNTVAVSGIISARSIELQEEITGSGGAVRIVANSVIGAGQINCVNFQINDNAYKLESRGRIRIETNGLSPTLQTSPETIGVPPANPPVIWPAANAPIARVISVDTVNAPIDPRAPLVAGADVAIQNSNAVNILIETQNFPIEGVVQLNITPKFGNRTTLTAAYLNGGIVSATWRVQTTLPQGFVTLQARATQP